MIFKNIYPINKTIISYVMVIMHSFFSMVFYAQTFESVKITGVVSGNSTNNTLFIASSPTIASLAYIRAQRIDGPQDGIFTRSSDNIRYTSTSKESGIPNNLSRIRFTFLKSDKKTPIPLHDFRVIINDIDGPNNEALATKCSKNLKHLATATRTNLVIDNYPPDLNIIGSVEENDGPTSRVLFEFSKVAEIEFDNYANYGYLKDFDFNYSAYRISNPSIVKCMSDEEAAIAKSAKETQRITALLPNTKEFIVKDQKVLINLNTIYFDFDKFNIRKDAEVELEKVVTLLNKYPKIKIALGSHTDSMADDRYNYELSENRANSTKQWIVAKGIEESRLSAKGYGEKQLVNKCANNISCSDEEHQLNRRTEFVIINPEDFK